MKKWLLRIALGLLLGFLISLVVVGLSLGTILKKAIERIGPTATQVDVKVKSTAVSLFDCRIELAQLVLGNPPGYTTPSSITAEDISVQIKARSVTADKLIVEKIYLKHPVITWEGGLKENNLKKIEDNLNHYIGSSSTAPNTAAAPASPAQPERKLQVDDLEIIGAKLQLKMKLTGEHLITVPLPTIHLTGLGVGPQGITPVEVAQRTLHEIMLTSTAEVLKHSGDIGKKAAESGKGIMGKASNFFKKLFH